MWARGVRGNRAGLCVAGGKRGCVARGMLLGRRRGIDGRAVGCMAAASTRKIKLWGCGTPFWPGAGADGTLARTLGRMVDGANGTYIPVIVGM